MTTKTTNQLIVEARELFETLGMTKDDQKAAIAKASAEGKTAITKIRKDEVATLVATLLSQTTATTGVPGEETTSAEANTQPDAAPSEPEDDAGRSVELGTLGNANMTQGSSALDALLDPAKAEAQAESDKAQRTAKPERSNGRKKKLTIDEPTTVYLDLSAVKALKETLTESPYAFTLLPTAEIRRGDQTWVSPSGAITGFTNGKVGRGLSWMHFYVEENGEKKPIDLFRPEEKRRGLPYAQPGRSATVGRLGTSAKSLRNQIVSKRSQVGRTEDRLNRQRAELAALEAKLAAATEKGAKAPASPAPDPEAPAPGAVPMGIDPLETKATNEVQLCEQVSFLLARGDELQARRVLDAASPALRLKAAKRCAPAGTRVRDVPTRKSEQIAFVLKHSAQPSA